MTALAALLLAAGGTFTLRYTSVRVFSNRTLDARVAVVLRHAALSIMAALVVASIPTDGALAVTNLAAIVGIGVGVIAGRRLGNISAIIGLAVAAYAAVDIIVG